MKRHKVWRFDTKSGVDFRIGRGSFDNGQPRNIRNGSTYVGYIEANTLQQAVTELKARLARVL